MSAVTDPALVVRHESCPLCKGASVSYLRDTHDFHTGLPGSWNYDRCRDCGVLFLNPAPTQQFLDGAYADDYYSYQEFGLPPRWEKWLRRLIAYDPTATGDPHFAKAGRVLDVGCGSGAFLYRMKLAGWETHGVEPSAQAARFGNERHQLNIQAGTLRAARLTPDSFDYIRLNHSFEHILDPRETLQLIHRYLAPDGLLFIGVPNVDGWPARWFGKHWWNLGPPVHPLNYSRGTLTRLLEQHGFEVARFRTNSNFAGILGSLQIALNDRAGVKRDTGALFSNPVTKVLSHWLAKLIDLFAAGDCLEIIARKGRKDSAK